MNKRKKRESDGRKRAGDSGGERVIGVKGGGEAEFVLMEITFGHVCPFFSFNCAPL